MRYFWFVLSILCGLIIGAVAASRLIPLPYENLQFSSLRADYKTDYVLMTAEVYHQNHQIEEAQDTLKQLGPESPVYHVQEAIVYARDYNYRQQDMEWMIELLQALQSSPTTVGNEGSQ